MNLFTKLTSAVLTACLLTAPVTCFASTAAANTAKAASTSPYYEAAVITPEDISVSRNIVLDYPQNIMTMEYTFTNTGDTDADCFLKVPVESSLSASHQELYSFVSEGNGEAFTYFTPLFSSLKDVSPETITSDILHSLQYIEALLPDDAGIFYTIELDEASEEITPILQVSTITDNTCRIYPIGCTYSGKEGVYQISATKEQTECYVFITGVKDTDFSADFIAENNVTITDEVSHLDDFIELGCELFLEANEMDELITKELLMQHLAVYLANSTASVALDLLPSLQWLTKQLLFEVYGYAVSVPHGESVTVSIVSNEELPVNGLSFNPILTNSQTALTSNTFEIIFPEEYTRASLRIARGSFDKDTSILTVKEAEKIYQVNLSKTPLWIKAYDYIVPMCVVMVAFLALCSVSYAARKKAQPPQK